MKKVIPQIKLNDEEFKKLRKNKQSIILRLNDEDNKNINTKDKVLLVNNKQKLKREIKNLYTYSTIEELSKNVKNKQLGYKKKDIIDYNNLIKDYTKEEIKKYGLLGLELKRKKHIFKKIILVLIIFIVLLFSIRCIDNKLDEMNVKKVNKSINELAGEKIDYVFIEINPYLLLSMKNGKVHAVTCLNQDCYKIYNDLRLEERNINESIDIIYNLSKEKGFDTSNGAKVKATGNIEIEEKEYISVERISESTKDEIISNIKDVDIGNTSNEDYYSKLWDTLKKDKDYDKVYSCNMNGKELECYFTDSIVNYNVDNDFDISKISDALFNIINGKVDKIANTFEKFGFNVEKNSYGVRNQITINDMNFSFVLSYVYNDKTYNNVLKADMIDEWKNNEVINVNGKKITLTCPDAINGMCQENIGVYILPLDRINLLNYEINFNKVIKYRSSNQSTKETLLDSIR